MVRSGWVSHPKRPETGWKPGQLLYQIHDEGDRIWFMPYEYVGESKHYVRLISGVRLPRPLPRSFLKTDRDLQSMYPSRAMAVAAYLRSKTRRLEETVRSIDDQKKDISRVLRLLAEAEPEFLNIADNADFVTSDNQGVDESHDRV